MEHNLPLAAQKATQHDDDGEEAHFQQVCRSYQQYATFHQTNWQGVGHRLQRLLNKTSASDAQIPSWEQHAFIDKNFPCIESILPLQLMLGNAENQKMNKEFCDATIRNQFFLDSVLQYSGVPTSQEALKESQTSNRRIDWASEDQMSKIDSVLKSVVRDWSVQGSKERKVVYDRILTALDKYVSLEVTAEEPPRVAVPGSGLGRLAWEIHAKGYTCQGSDFSLPMLMASDFMLNGCGIPDNNIHGKAGKYRCRQFKISPWIAETKNVPAFENRIKTVIVPDIDPSSIQNNNIGCGDDHMAPQFSMLAGEFLSLYSHFLPGRQLKHDCTYEDGSSSTKKFHAVACSFFLDTAPSLPEYLITIYHMLEDEGLLIHFGPLMYHWSGHGALLPRDLDRKGSIDEMNERYKNRNAYLDPRYLSSVDFTWSEVRCMIVNAGFEILEEELNVPAQYTSNPNSMMQVSYNCVFLVARKKQL